MKSGLILIPCQGRVLLISVVFQDAVAKLSCCPSALIDGRLASAMEAFIPDGGGGMFCGEHPVRER